MTLATVIAALRALGRAHHDIDCHRLDKQAARASTRGGSSGDVPPSPPPGRRSAPSPRQPGPGAPITSAMVCLAWAVLERPGDCRSSVALAQRILQAVGDLPDVNAAPRNAGPRRA